MDTLTIIIPHKDIPDLLGRCLDSIPQSDGLRIIVIDDNSNPDIVNFNDFPGKGRPDIKIMFDKVGGGAGYARNIGLGNADSQWVMFADADDYFVPGFFDIVSKFFDLNYDAVLFKNVSVRSETGKPSTKGAIYNTMLDNGLTGSQTIRQTFASVPAPWAKLISLEFLRSNHICFDEIRWSNDVMFSAGVACYGCNLGLSSDVIYVVTSRSGSLSENRFTHDGFLARWEVLCRGDKFMIHHGINRPWLVPRLRLAGKIGIATFFCSLWTLTENGLLFTGMGRWVVEKISSKRRALSGTYDI